MILTGIFLGLMSWVSVVMTFIKWPARMKAWIVQHELIADIMAGLGVWLLLGAISKTLTAVIGATIAEILLGATLHWYIKNHEHDVVPASYGDLWDTMKTWTIWSSIKKLFQPQRYTEDESSQWHNPEQ